MKNTINIKTTYLLIFALACTLFSSCMNGDWDEPDFNGAAPYGNNSLTEQNVITIAELIKKYHNLLFESTTDQNKQIDEDIMIKGRITGNDVGGNIYKQVTLQDNTAAIIIAINEGGLNGYLAEGSEILVDLKGLYIGGYRKQPEIGAPYNGTSIGRMQKDIWAKHFKILGSPDASLIQPVDFNTIKNKMDDNCAKLVTLKDVTFKEADGKSTFSTGTSTGNAVNQELDGYGSKVVIRTSTYADFAAIPLPYDTVAKKKLKCDITGIATRYNSTWQILIRKTSDIVVKQ
mgnify:FL=1|uniref:DUF5689 domain-containing protein n=1 Tax=Prevotella sp. TaxID=59823 RepID=UPI003FEF22DA